MFNKKIYFFFFLAFFGISMRVFLNDIPNFEPVTSVVFLSGSLLGGLYGIFLAFLIMFFSDIVLGNGYIFVFTWLSFALMGIFGSFLKKDSNNYFLKAISGGVGMVLFFFLFTNFGWWLISGMYPVSLGGLIQCYIAGIPFLKNQLISLFLFLPSVLLIHTFVFKENELKLSKRIFINFKKNYETKKR